MSSDSKHGTMTPRPQPGTATSEAASDLDLALAEFRGKYEACVAAMDLAPDRCAPSDYRIRLQSAFSRAAEVSRSRDWARYEEILQLLHTCISLRLVDEPAPVAAESTPKPTSKKGSRARAHQRRDANYAAGHPHALEVASHHGYLTADRVLSLMRRQASRKVADILTERVRTSRD